MNKFCLRICLPFFAILLFTPFLFSQDTTKTPDLRFTKESPNKNTDRYLKPQALIIPTSLLLYGCLKPAIRGIQNVDDDIRAQVLKQYPNFKTSAADYLMWAPSAALYTLKALNVPTKHSFKEQLVIEAGSIIITGGVGIVMRKISGSMNVYNKDDTKFPSGHTANTFRGAEIFHQELKDSHKVLSYAGYFMASGVGALRIINKNHLLTEVLAGAGLGILSTKLTYWIFEKISPRNLKNNL